MDDGERNRLVRGMAALYRAAVLDVLINRCRWSAEAAAGVADDVEASVRARAAEPLAGAEAPRRSRRPRAHP